VLCTHLADTLSRLDVLINNACQTVRRPAGWYDHVIAGEAEPWSSVGLLERGSSSAGARSPRQRQGRRARRGAARDRIGDTGRASGTSARSGCGAPPCSRRSRSSPTIRARRSPLSANRLDADLQQVDLRDFSSWRMTLAECRPPSCSRFTSSTPSPFVLNARLRPLLAAVPTRDAHVVNVSAMEVVYRRWKTDKHPHTNMAKAALNMMTRVRRRVRARWHP
jgi:NAD(P)-dependent dehydrogenase (short-subunit alcohol dehydrogenase family)